MTTAKTPTVAETAAPAAAASPDTASPAAAASPDPAEPDADETATEPDADGTATEPDADGTAEAGPRRRGRPKGSTARTTRTIELMLTVSGTADGEWQADLKQGSGWLTRGLPVTAAAVLRAAQELHPEIAGPIDAVIGAAREQRAARVAALEAELAEARKALAEMEDSTP